MCKTTIKENMLFDIKEFIANQLKIYLKFIPPTFSNSDLERFDKLFINLNEEMFEYIDENDIDKKKEELVDVIMYTGTCIVVWYNHYGDCIDKLLNQANIISVPIEYNLPELFTNHNLQLIKMRRNFSERKWHKPVDYSQDVTEYVLEIVLINLAFLKVYINTLFCMDNSMEKVIERIKNKQEFIINLPIRMNNHLI